MNENKAAIERRREAVGSLENKGNASVAQSPARSLARGRRDWNKSERTATLLRIHIARQLPVSNNSQADCSCIIKGTKLISRDCLNFRREKNRETNEPRLLRDLRA